MNGYAIVLASVVTLWQPVPTANALVTLMTTAPDWHARVSAAQELALMLDDQPQLVESDELALPIAALIRQESEALLASIASHESRPPGREQLYDELPRIAEAFLKRHDPLPKSFVEAAASVPHNSASYWTVLMARQGLPAAEVGAAMMMNVRSFHRVNGISLVAEAVRAQDVGIAKAPLTTGQRISYVQTIRLGLQDASDGVRRAAIRALVLIHDTGAVPLLIQLSTTDPDASGTISVRAFAVEAVKQLKQ